ncbi:hypothetical protein GCM10009069_07500 [Algimonas arctica]|uniref:Uncharacterized protein n=1 Tax=Algimonas arctica TaxID=1479486 RepID=A0A8J3CPD1_9PROT|nr:hypothetical protein [Algimonas arctica]GHA86769.1 hypothetical protein GCM10009069_07500 [Algimonas arctica]
MTAPDPLITRSAAQGRPVDRMIAGLATLGFIASLATKLWFFIGFAETDPGFSPASSAFLLSFMLGAFAIIPCAFIARLAWTAWRTGFVLSYGVWSLLLSLPWVGLALIASRSDWMPGWLSVGPLLIALPTACWAIASIILLSRDSSERIGGTDR